jgi:tetratricopeptide (TPR) repeat protein
MSLLDELLDASNDKPVNSDHIDEAEAKSLPLNEKIDTYFGQINKNWLGKEGKPYYQGMTKQEFQNQYNSFYSGIQEAQHAVSLGFSQSFQNHIYLAHTLASVERYDDAVQVLKSVTAQDENQRQAYEELSAIYCRVGMYEEAALCGQRVYDLHQIEENKFKKSPDPMRCIMGVKLYPEYSFFYAVSSIKLKDFQQAKNCCVRGISDLGNFGIKETDHDRTGGRYGAIALSHFLFLEGYIHYQETDYESAMNSFYRANHFTGKNSLLTSIIEEMITVNSIDLSNIPQIQGFKNSIISKDIIGSQEIDYIYSAAHIAVANLATTEEEISEFYKVAFSHYETIPNMDLLSDESLSRMDKILAIQRDQMEDPLEVFKNLKNERIKNVVCISLIEISTHFMADELSKESISSINRICQELKIDEMIIIKSFHFYRDMYFKRMTSDYGNRKYYLSDDYLNQDIYYIWAMIFVYLKFTNTLSDDSLNLMSHYIARISQNSQVNTPIAKQYFVSQEIDDLIKYILTNDKPSLFYIPYAIIIEEIAKNGGNPSEKEMVVLENFKSILGQLCNMEINIHEDIDLMRLKNGL